VEEQPLDERARAVLGAIRTAKKVTQSEALALTSLAAPEYLQSLLDLGLLARGAKGRGKKAEPAFEVTDAAREALKPPPRPRAPRAKKPPPVTLDDLRAMEARILDALAARFATPAAPPQPAPKRDGDLRTAIPTAIRDADLAGRFGGMVPIPEIRKVVQSRTGASRTEFDEVLLALEREFRVDLKIANDPRRPDSSEGIAVPGRGLVFFALSK
jgi:hypothetical protein